MLAVDDSNNSGAPSDAAQAVVVLDSVTVTLAPSADAWVGSTVPTKNYGNAWALTVDASPQQEADLSFNIPAATGGRTLTGATLQIGTSTATWAGSPGTAQVQIAGSPWTESTITWNNRPTALAGTIGTLAAGTTSNTNYTVALDVSKLQSSVGGSLPLMLTTTSNDGFQFVSKEGAQNRAPRLILTYS